MPLYPYIINSSNENKIMMLKVYYYSPNSSPKFALSNKTLNEQEIQIEIDHFSKTTSVYNVVYLTQMSFNFHDVFPISKPNN